MQLQKSLELTGLSAKEAKTYLASLRLGEAHVSDLAAKVKLPRSSVQAILEKLQRDGLMSHYVMHRYKYWVPARPEKLADMLKQRESALKEALPELEALHNANWGKQHKKGESLGMLRLLADGSTQPILVTDEQATIVHVNAAWERQFGYSRNEVVGQNPRMLKSGKTPPEVHAAMWQALGKGRMFQSDAVIDKRKDGSFFSLLTTIFPVRQGSRLFYVQILDDITERKRAASLAKKFSNAG